MPRIRYSIELREKESVELLFSVTLGLVAKRKGISLTMEDSTDVEQRLGFFVRLFYVAALNAWEYKSLDDPGLGDFPYKAIDFAEWASANSKEFARMITETSEALRGLNEGGEVKKK